MPAKPRRGIFSLVLCISIALLLTASLPPSVSAGDLEDGLGNMVKDFQRLIGQVPAGQKYSVVVRFFSTEENKQPVRICSRIEAILVYHLVERFAGTDTIEVLDRNRVEATDAEIAFQADPLRGGAGDWARKFGQKKGAGFLITGTTAMMSRDFEISASMIDIVTGAVVASSRCKVPISSIDPILLADYPGRPVTTSTTTYPTTTSTTTYPSATTTTTYRPYRRQDQDESSSGGYTSTQATYSRINRDQLEALLRKAGYDPVQVKDRTLRVEMDGLKVLFFTAENQLNIQAYAGFSGGGVSLDTINEWNKNKRFSHAYLDNDNDPAIELDLDLDGGYVSEEQIMAYFGLVRISVTTFKTHIWGN